MQSLNDYINEQDHLSSNRTYTDCVRQAVRLGRKPSHDMWVARTTAECKAIYDTAVLRPRNGSAGNFKFIGFTQAEVDELGTCLDLATDMLNEALRHVGLHTWPGRTNFEMFFGARALHGQSAARRTATLLDGRDMSGFALRAAYVRHKIGQILASLRHPDWLVMKNSQSKFVAAAKGLGQHFMEIGSGFPAGTPRYLHAGVLIHEVGHNVGLADICDSCNPKMLGYAHYTQRADADIAQCQKPAHGDNGHFIDKEPVLRLAAKHKNAAIYNADSYRYYCYSFFLSQVRADYAVHAAAVPPP